MKSFRIQKFFTASAMTLFAGMALSACNSSTSSNADFQSDGVSGFVNQEAVSMGQAFNSEGYGKSASDSTDTVTGEIILTRLHYNDTCHCFVRQATFSFTFNDKSFVRERRDSIWLTDSAGNPMTSFRPFQAASITHHRHVTRIGGSVDIEVQFNTTFTWVTDGNGNKTGAIWNGTVTGTYNGVEFKNTTITSVKRPVTFFGFGFPTEGAIHIARGNFTLDITFKGAGKADVVVTGNGKTHHLECTGGVEVRKD